MVYHLGLGRETIEGAEFAILPGDPGRVGKIAREIDGESHQIGNNREFRSFLCEVFGESVLVVSTGIGGPSLAIAVEELALLGVHTFIRVGTSGAIQDSILPGNVVITTASLRMDGTSKYYAPIYYPAVSDHNVLSSLKAAAERLKIPHNIGITTSTDSFYPGQERTETFSQTFLKSLEGSLDEWKRLNVLNIEMESATLLTMASALGLRAGCVSGVLVNRNISENITHKNVELAESNSIKVAIEALKALLKEWHWKN